MFEMKEFMDQDYLVSKLRIHNPTFQQINKLLFNGAQSNV